MNDKQRTSKIIRASWIAVGGNAGLAVLKIAVGLIAGSLAVVGDGLDSAGDIVTSLITLFTARIISKPPDMKFPYGYRKADTIAAKALSFVIFFAGAQLAISTVKKLVEGGSTVIPETIAVYVIILSVFAKAALSYYLLQTGRKIESPMLIANGKNMRNDVVISLSVLLGLILTIGLKMPVIDSVFALLISLWIMKSGYDIFMETNVELMDGVSDQQIYTKIFNAVEQVRGANNPHRVRVRKLANMYVIGLDIEVDPVLNVGDAHQIARNLEQELKKNIHNVYDVVVHIEPIGNVEKDEIFGISAKDMNT